MKSLGKAWMGGPPKTPCSAVQVGLPWGGPGAVLAAGAPTQAKPGRRGNGDCKTEVSDSPVTLGTSRCRGTGAMAERKQCAALKARGASSRGWDILCVRLGELAWASRQLANYSSELFSFSK